MEKLCSNPMKCFVNGYEEVEFKYEPKGNIPYCVRISEGNWIPVNVLVFSDSIKNAILTVKKSVNFIIDNYHKDYGDKEPEYATMRDKKQKQLRNLLRNGKVQCHKIQIDQLFKIAWAENDHI